MPEIDFVHLLMELFAEHIDDMMHSKGSGAKKSLKPLQNSLISASSAWLCKYL
jgi:hypothetical protein